ncbi:hypothetical protein HMPREF9444_00265 [Succinatimonas hippei YIT 12066]|uniref:Uncharacterized protein n=1 Tax=Succinatimonas hippei (strain DSM 22608 / JCM 16073 / KCTC 15190 / YIT 12066) TaxID=762983 RepID=E8LHV2_SUCHY|nr:hypothetical protein HMPREF9444_00265 [Succinatimonas hippei YIT 12066]
MSIQIPYLCDLGHVYIFCRMSQKFKKICGVSLVTKLKIYI